MKIVDLHCDALLKLWEDRSRSYTNSKDIQANYNRLKKGNVKVQLFAIFIEPDVPFDQKYQQALEQIDLFHREVVQKHSNMIKINHWNEIETLTEGQIGAILTLEGADAFGNDITKLRTLYSLGVKSLGLTWNNANLVADGVGEPRGAGLTSFGFEVVKLNNEYQVLTDVSHLSEKGFWDVIEVAKYPIATHSNAKAVCNHRRNLTDEQIRALIKKQGLLGIVFHQLFVTGKEQANITDVIKHIDHVAALGGENHLCFGSDFDGIDLFVKGLENAACYQTIINELLNYYSEDFVRGIAFNNFLRYRPKD